MKSGLTLELVPGCKLPFMRAGQLAKAVGVSTDTLRHYERMRLLPIPPRTSGNYREYPASALDRVRLIRRALGAGFALRELAPILGVRDRGGVPCLAARAMAETKLRDVKQQIRDLQAMRKQLRTILTDWNARLRRTRKGQPARLLENLPAEFERRRRATSMKTKRRNKGD
jgi:DNA-binding transcriptional MerR regulator